MAMIFSRCHLSLREISYMVNNTWAIPGPTHKMFEATNNVDVKKIISAARPRLLTHFGDNGRDVEAGDDGGGGGSFCHRHTET